MPQLGIIRRLRRIARRGKGVAGGKRDPQWRTIASVHEPARTVSTPRVAPGPIRNTPALSSLARTAPRRPPETPGGPDGRDRRETEARIPHRAARQRDVEATKPDARRRGGYWRNRPFSQRIIYLDLLFFSADTVGQH